MVFTVIMPDERGRTWKNAVNGEMAKINPCLPPVITYALS
jgi:hypothetical protein